MCKLLIIGLLSTAMTAPIYAEGNGNGKNNGGGGDCENCHVAPEINSASASSALLLLGGSMLVVTGRRRKQYSK